MGVFTRQQKTLRNPIRASGIGLHSGERSCMTLRPAGVDTGIVFRRMDLPGQPLIPAGIQNVCDTQLSTTLASAGATVSTVEHLLSALAGLGIDNSYVELSGPEVPIMDGSAAPFVFLIQSAGIRRQNKPKRFVRIRRSVMVQQGDKWARLDPYVGFKAAFTIDFEHPVFRQQTQQLEIDFSTSSYAKELARARTFGFLQDIAHLRERRLALGGGLDNAIVVGDDRIMNEDGLRVDGEFVRHKLLDAIGDLYLLGHALIGSFVGYKSGHALNTELLYALLNNRDAWETVVVTGSGMQTVALPNPAHAA
jgi:UDP-3-O-[3-hydroxymyristoyl] N-acetylglucosamine deacetylase